MSKLNTKHITDKAVTLAKMADLVKNTIIGRVTASTGVPEALTAANVKTILSLGTTDDVTFGDITGDKFVVGSNINSQTGTTYTLVLTDNGKFIKHSNASASTLTVPPNSSVAFPTGTEISIMQYGAGALTIAKGNGVTIVSKDDNLKVADQYVAVALKKLGTDEWFLAGDLA